MDPAGLLGCELLLLLNSTAATLLILLILVQVIVLPINYILSLYCNGGLRMWQLRLEERALITT
jgi:hypothetical protein